MKLHIYLNNHTTLPQKFRISQLPENSTGRLRDVWVFRSQNQADSMSLYPRRPVINEDISIWEGRRLHVSVLLPCESTASRRWLIQFVVCLKHQPAPQSPNGWKEERDIKIYNSDNNNDNIIVISRERERDYGRVKTTISRAVRQYGINIISKIKIFKSNRKITWRLSW